KKRTLGASVAILREANTAFGVRSKVSKDNGASTYDPIDLPFPISISQLAAHSHKNGKRGLSLPHTDFVPKELPVRDLNFLDAVPPYDPQAAASIASQALREILTTIDQARVRYVGIVATDARDVVFLTSLLRTECPNVMVFTT